MTTTPDTPIAGEEPMELPDWQERFCIEFGWAYGTALEREQLKREPKDGLTPSELWEQSDNGDKDFLRSVVKSAFEATDIVRACNAYPSLIAQRDELVKERDELKKALSGIMDVLAITDPNDDGDVRLPSQWVDGRVFDLARTALQSARKETTNE